jgi:transposase
MHLAGIDISAKDFNLAIRRGEKTAKARRFENTPEGHQQALKALHEADVQRVCLEATGTYHLDLAVVLHDAGLQVMVANPKAIKHFAEARGTRNKTDAIDAALLAEFLQRMEFVPWRRPDDRALAIRACSRRISAVNTARTAAKNQLHAARQTAVTPAVILEDLEQSIAYHTEQIERLRQHVLTLIAEDAQLQHSFQLLLSVKGIATASAIALLGELLVLPEDMQAKQWVALAGLDPRVHESGTSVKKPPRLSKAGNRYLRIALYMPALAATRHDPNVRAYYQHLINTRGLKKIQAVCAVMRKLLHAIHAVLKTRTPFDSTRFSAASATTPV